MLPGESTVSGNLGGEVPAPPDRVVSERGLSGRATPFGFSEAYAADTACAAAMSSAFADAWSFGSDCSKMFVFEDIGLMSELSEMPSWARLRFPDPSVSTAS
jgi:hypothetical protein